MILAWASPFKLNTNLAAYIFRARDNLHSGFQMVSCPWDSELAGDRESPHDLINARLAP